MLINKIDNRVRNSNKILGIDKNFVTNNLANIYYTFHEDCKDNKSNYFSENTDRIKIYYQKYEYENALDELENIESKHTLQKYLPKLYKFSFVLTIILKFLFYKFQLLTIVLALDILLGVIVFIGISIYYYYQGYFDYINPLSTKRENIYFEKYLRDCINKINEGDDKMHLFEFDMNNGSNIYASQIGDLKLDESKSDGYNLGRVLNKTNIWLKNENEEPMQHIYNNDKMIGNINVKNISYIRIVKSDSGKAKIN